MKNMPSAILYTIDASSLNRYLWWSLDDNKDHSKEEKRKMLEVHKEVFLKKVFAKLDELITTKVVISHQEVCEELKNAKNTTWTRETEGRLTGEAMYIPKTHDGRVLCVVIAVALIGLLVWMVFIEPFTYRRTRHGTIHETPV